MNVNMKNLKEKFRKVEDWKGWKWGYSLEIILLVIASSYAAINIRFDADGGFYSFVIYLISYFSSLFICMLIGSILSIKYIYRFFLLPLVFLLFGTFLMLIASETKLYLLISN